MSEGLMCNCPRPEHEGQRPPGKTGCPHYAENQRIGGMCRSCNFTFHRPCHEIVLPMGAIAGVCLRCSWHSSQHR